MGTIARITGLFGESAPAAKANLGTYLNRFNTRRLDQSLDGKMPDTIYFAGLPNKRIAA